jgi:hypothetical protein
VSGRDRAFYLAVNHQGVPLRDANGKIIIHPSRTQAAKFIGERTDAALWHIETARLRRVKKETP